MGAIVSLLIYNMVVSLGFIVVFGSPWGRRHGGVATFLVLTGWAGLIYDGTVLAAVLGLHPPRWVGVFALALQSVAFTVRLWLAWAGRHDSGSTAEGVVKMQGLNPYVKAVAGALTAGFGALLTALADNGVTAVEWVIVAIAVVGGFTGVWASAANSPARVAAPAESDATATTVVGRATAPASREGEPPGPWGVVSS